MAAYLILAHSRVLILRQVLPYTEEAKLITFSICGRGSRTLLKHSLAKNAQSSKTVSLVSFSVETPGLNARFANLAVGGNRQSKAQLDHHTKYET
jgi:hypothetical protein